MLRIVAWGAIALAVAFFLIAGDVRTAWVVGDVGPISDEVALPRLGVTALMLGFVLLAIHQVRARRSLPAERYRGPAVMVLFGLIIGLSSLMVLPVRRDINALFEGGVPAWTTVVIWMAAGSLAFLLVSWLGVLRPNALHGAALFRDSRPLRHGLLGVAVGAATSVAILAARIGIDVAAGGQPLQVSPIAPEGVLAETMPPVVGVLLVVVLTPIAEETFFRGVMLNAWLREYGVRMAIASSSVVFGLAHFGLTPLEWIWEEIPRLSLLAIGGVVLAILAVRTRSLVAPIAAHAAMNGTLLIVGATLSALAD